MTGSSPCLRASAPPREPFFREEVGGKPIEIRPYLGLKPNAWCKLVGQFGGLVINVAGKPQTISATRTRIGQHRCHLRKETRELLSAQ